MKLRDLFDEQWKKWEKQRFLNDDTKSPTENFDPESFKHDGFEDRETYIETYAPALSEQSRLSAEVNDFTPPRLKSINNSPYQALVIRYGILRMLIQQPDYCQEKSSLLEDVQAWQQKLIENFSAEDVSEDDDILHLAKAAIDYRNDIDDSELHMIYSYFELHNRSCDRKHDYYTWLDFFKRLSSIDRFPKVSRSEKPEHALDTIEKGLWSLQEQAIVYEISDADNEDIVGIPEDYAEYVRDWLYYEMSEENYLKMLEELEPFESQSNLVGARDTFGVDTPTEGLNQKRRESLVKAGVFPSELLAEVLDKSELKDVVDEYGLDAHKSKTDEMIHHTIEYFEQSQKVVERGEPEVDLYLKCYEEISDGNIDRVPPQLQTVIDEDDQSAKLDILFEKATAEVCEEIFSLEGTNRLGQGASGIVADGEIEQNGKWLLWDNKRRAGEFRLDSNTQSKIKNYIDTKKQQHDVEWFLIIAPEFSETARKNAAKLEMQVGIDVRLVRATDFKQLATFWRDEIGKDGQELPLSIFYGSGTLNLDVVKDGLETQFS
jgi:hypothetical protein